MSAPSPFAKATSRIASDRQKRVSASKADGSFKDKQKRFNETSNGKQMDDDGNISDRSTMMNKHPAQRQIDDINRPVDNEHRKTVKSTTRHLNEEASLSATHSRAHAAALLKRSKLKEGSPEHASADSEVEEMSDRVRSNKNRISSYEETIKDAKSRTGVGEGYFHHQAKDSYSQDKAIEAMKKMRARRKDLDQNHTFTN